LNDVKEEERKISKENNSKKQERETRTEDAIGKAALASILTGEHI